MFGNKIRLNAFDRLMMAVAFAEAGEPETALEVANEKPVKKNRKQRRGRPERRRDDRPPLMA